MMHTSSQGWTLVEAYSLFPDRRSHVECGRTAPEHQGRTGLDTSGISAVWTASAGNTGLVVAWYAKRLRLHWTVIVPEGLFVLPGLSCGIASVLNALRPEGEVYAAETENGAPFVSSMER